MTKKSLRTEIKENAHDWYVALPKCSMRYIDEWLTMRAAVDMQTWGLFPNAKEIQESFAAFRAVRYRILRGLGRAPAALGDRNVGVVVIGDGSTPRTAATFALRSRWKTVSVDPQLKKCDVWEARVQGLKCFNLCDFELPASGGLKQIEQHLEDCETVLLIMVHSHAKLPQTLDVFRELPVKGIVTNPCCVPHDLQAVAQEKHWNYDEYEDWGMWSPQRTVKMAWQGVTK